MALRFSDTELFKAPISRKQALSILKNDGIKTQFQSPVYVPAKIFERLYTIGGNCQQKED